MPNETGTASDIQDLLTKLETFISQSPGFVIDSGMAAASPFYFAVHRDDLYVQFTGDVADVGGETIQVYMSTGYDGSGPGAEPGSNIAFNTSASGGNRINNIDGPYESYYFYANFDDSAGKPVYCHVVLEYAAGLFRHFGFGSIRKFGTWEGGEYAYGHYWAQGTSNIDNAGDRTHHVLFDGGLANEGGATDRIHMRFIDDNKMYVQSPNRKWAVPSSTLGFPGLDGDGVQKNTLYMGYRAGWWGEHFYQIPQSVFNGFKPLLPIATFIRDPQTTPDNVRFLGFTEDVRMVNMDGLIPKQTLDIAGDTWRVFPLTRKQALNNDTEESDNLGIAYREIA